MATTEYNLSYIVSKTVQESMRKLQLRQISLQDESARCLEKVKKIKRKKEGYEHFILAENERAQNKEFTITKEIRSLEEQLKDLSNQIPEIPDINDKRTSKANGDPAGLKQLKEFLTRSIKEKEFGLECPVCLETADIPIYSCTKQHLICSLCRPKVKECPICKERYEV